MPEKELKIVLAWVTEKLRGDTSDPPWTWYQYMKLREVMTHVLNGCDPLTPLEGLPPVLKVVD